MKHLKTKTTAALGLAAGYVLGSRAGRERYERLKSTATDVWKSPRVQDTVQATEQAAQDHLRQAAEAVKDKVQSDKDVDGATSQPLVDGIAPSNAG